MRPLTITAAMAAALVLGACSSEQAPDALSAPTPSLAAGATGSTCDASQLKSDARAYFASSTDPIFTIIGDLQSLSKSGPNDLATNKAFDGLARIAVGRTTTGLLKSTATAAGGSKLALDFVGCMQTTITSTLPTTLDFTAALSAGGMFVVRGGTADSRTDEVGSFGATAAAWVVKPSQSATWGAAGNGVRFLLYGSPLGLSSPLVNDSPIAGTTGFDFNTVPSGVTFSPKLIVGTCVATGNIQHAGTVLGAVDITCPAESVAAIEPRANGVDGALRAIGDFFAPKPAYAAMMLAAGVGGLSGSFSPYWAVDVTGISDKITAQPVDGFVNTPIPGGTGGFVEVRVATAGGTAIEGAVVTLKIAGNNGSFVASGTVATTEADGVARFRNFQLDKAGGYTLTATASFAGLTGPTTAVSNLYNIKNKLP